MESLHKLKDSLIGVAKSAHSRPYTIYVVGRLKDVVDEHPNDTNLGEALRQVINTSAKHYNI